MKEQDPNEQPVTDRARDILPAGSRFGPFRLVRLLGDGVTGTVYEAERETSLGPRCAVRVLPPGLPSEGGAAAAVARHARTLTTLVHPNIVRVRDTGCTAGRYWLAMEWVEPAPLASDADARSDAPARTVANLAELAQARDTRIPEEELVLLLAETVAAFAYAHRFGVVHGALTARSVLLCRTAGHSAGRAMVTGFGLAALLEAGGIEWGETGRDGAAPRGAAGRAADVRTFVALAGTLLTGRPFSSDTPPSACCPGIAAGWDEMAAYTIAMPDAELRNWRELNRLLHEVHQAVDTRARGGARPEPDWQDVQQARARAQALFMRRVWLGMLGAVLVSVAACASWQWLRVRDARRPDQPEKRVPFSESARAPGPAAESVLRELRELRDAGALLEAKTRCETFLGTVSGATQAAAEQLLGEINVRLVIGPDPMPLKRTYVTTAGDTLSRVARRFKTTPELIMRISGLENRTLRPRMALGVFTGKFRVEVRSASRQLTVLLDDAFFQRYRIGVGAYDSTAMGRYQIIARGARPDAPKGRYIQGGDWGSHWLVLNHPALTMHGTWDPDRNVGHDVGWGSIRLSNHDIAELYVLLPVGTEVAVFPD